MRQLRCGNTEVCWEYSGQKMWKIEVLREMGTKKTLYLKSATVEISRAFDKERELEEFDTQKI